MVIVDGAQPKTRCQSCGGAADLKVTLTAAKKTVKLCDQCAEVVVGLLQEEEEWEVD